MAAVLELPEIPKLYESHLAAVDRKSEAERPLSEDDLDEVWDFLDHHLFLVPVLKEALVFLSDIFGEKGQGSIFVETDPEVEDWEYLVVAIHTQLPANQAEVQLKTFDETWWLENLPRARDKLLFTLEFV